MSTQVAKAEDSRPTTTSPPEQQPEGGYAIVYHGHAYEKAMKGLHGQQLEKAQLEGVGKDDEPFDPFLEDEIMEERLVAQQMMDENKKNGEEGEQEELNDEEDDDNDDDDDEFETVNEDEMTYNEKYNNDGSLRRTNAQKAILRAGWPSGGMFAIVKMAGSQFKVVPDDVLIVNRLKPRNKWTVGSVHTLKDEDVLLLGTSHYTLVGLPFVAGAEVDVMVEEITKGEKVVIFKKRRRKHSQRKKGFRRDVTMLRILNVRPPESLSGENYRARIETEYKPLPDDFDLDEEEDGDYYDEEEDELEGEEDEKQSKAVA